MKNKCKILVVLTLVIVCSLYRFDSVVAMENKSNAEQRVESTAESETEQSVEADVELGTEQILDSAEDSEMKQSIELTIESETEPELEQSSEPEAEPTTESAIVSEQAPDYISTGPALIEWLESHKNTGGSVKLTDNVILDGYYAFCPGGINLPPVFVDTDKYTITIAGEIELLSDDHLTFSGQPDGKGIFYVAPKGLLFLSGVAVESGQCAIWQEEGAGLVFEDCHISGDIHYADTPFVMYEKSICAVVEKGQTLNDALPTQLICKVNSHGDVSYNPMPVSWSLEGTEKQQEERLRFQIQGSFVNAASYKELFCTVVYNDYPLTFTDMKASLSYNVYLFLGGYTKPEERLPITVISEYSFDGENWLMYEEKVVSNVNAYFELCLESEQWDTAAYPNIYLRQQWNDNGTIHFSNVLRYAADNLECEQDIGGSRGGGTSITNPPAEPQKSNDDSSYEEQAENAKGNSDSDKARSKAPSGTNHTENGGSDSGSDAASEGYSSNTESQNTKADQSSNAGTQNVGSGKSSNTDSQNVSTGQSSYSETKTDNGVIIANGSEDKDNTDNSDPAFYEESKKTTTVSLYEENSGNHNQITEQTLRSDISQGNNIVIAIICVVLSVIAGIVGFFAHASLSGTKR
ncbi:MAG: hypothetical protein HDR03_13945 [Lachnospiraceae bacterium]|nr:hypothetical protein [Lachnospiraceae bacterium]